MRFFVVGFGTFLIDYAILNTLYYGLNLKTGVAGLSVANFISSGVATLITFAINRWWTFGIKTRDRLTRQSAKYLASVAVIFLQHNIAFSALIGLAIPAWFAKLTVMAVQMFVSFVVYKFVMFT